MRGGFHGRHGPGGRIGRFLEHGDLRFVVLALLAEQPRHGYDLIRELEERTGGAYRPSPGVIYPTLSLLEDEGFVVPNTADGRKQYEITDEGRAALEKERPAVDAVFGRMAEAQAQSTQTGPRIRRAMENLASALRIRLSSGEVGDAQVETITKAIDAAAAAIERA
ncbi:PadR family transcriptional regulator [Phenylobacterium sp.]|jgi:DNA-binding PadR family transcriptional regulator|uniref:PadR family transcriptional regulator n=1 Tax=Phenylobacterium sp. TaxID=1871053 RepID=UPI002F42E29B